MLSMLLPCSVWLAPRFGRRRVVVRKGHRGSSFYFVFSGQIAVTQDQDGSSAFIDPEPIFMMKGASFGEVALLKDLRRNATIVCMEETELLVVDREDFFNHQLDQELHREFQRRYSFFRSLDLFCSWSDEDLATLADHCKVEEFNHGQVILRDSSETKNIVFITKRAVDVEYVESCLGKDGRLPPQQLQNVWAKPSPCRDPRAMVLVSQGCEVIRVKLDKFSEMVDRETLEKLKRGSHSYPRTLWGTL
ncbi:UNVERIFIED_CONTAM: hypothetical protein FKN15_069574 [Acipenser sinensis]